MATSAADLQGIIDGPGTKSAKARALFTLGLERTEVVELLDMTYSQAHTLYKEVIHPEGLRIVKAKRHHSTAEYALQLSPSQTRYITQDGHVILKVDRGNVVTCKACGESVQFSLKYLGFIHVRSTSEPTKIEDHYAT